MEITFERFVKIIDTIKDHDFLTRNFSKFLESEICRNSYCYVTVGENLQQCIIEMLCDYFGIPQSDKYNENDIEWWLYESSPKIFYFDDGSQLNVESIRDFYDYLSNYKKIIQERCKDEAKNL